MRFFTLSFACLLSCPFAPAIYGQDAEFDAIRKAVGKVESAVVQIETIGGATSNGEVSIAAPISGTIVDPDGFILTSLWGFAQEPASILVVLADGRRLSAAIVARDTSRELVLLKVDAQKALPFVRLDRDAPVTVGQWAIAVGRGISPKSPAMTVGIVSAKHRMMGRAMQIDARVSPPFYGGPVVDIRGEVLGVSVPMKPDAVSASDEAGWYDSGIAFVVPAIEIAKRLERLKAGEDVLAGKMGIVPSGKVPFSSDVTLSAVLALSPAKRAGIEAKDKLLEIDGQAVKRLVDIKRLLGRRDAGDTVAIKIQRGQQQMDFKVKLVDDIPPFRPQTLGVLAQQEGGRIELTHIFEQSPAAKAGLREGDVIQKAAGKVVDSLEQLRLTVSTNPEGEVLGLEIKRGNEEQDLQIEPLTLPKSLPVMPEVEGLDAESYEIVERTLPGAPNKAHLLKPKDQGADGLLVFLARPGQEQLEEQLEGWRSVAAANRLGVLLVAAADPKRWQPDEVDDVVKLVEQAQKSLVVRAAQIATVGEGAGAKMALMLAFRQRQLFRAAIVPIGTRPGGFSLKENDPANPLQVLITGGDDVPMWAGVVSARGFPVIHYPGESDEPLQDDAVREVIGQWIRSLERI